MERGSILFNLGPAPRGGAACFEAEWNKESREIGGPQGKAQSSTCPLLSLSTEHNPIALLPANLGFVSIPAPARRI
jgi:hypothetical protein